MIAEFSVVPIGVGVSLSGPVATAVRVVRESGLRHEVHPMGTIKIDSRRGPTPPMGEKVKSVERQLGD